MVANLRKFMLQLEEKKQQNYPRISQLLLPGAKFAVNWRHKSSIFCSVAGIWTTTISLQKVVADKREC